MPAANPDTYTGRPGRTLHAGKTDPLANAPAPPPPPPPPGPGVTLTTVSLDSKSTGAQTLVPSTFGQPFAQGHWNPETHNLFARIGVTSIPLQADEIALHVDGSVRFAVLSAELDTLAASETKVLELYTDSAAPQAAPTLAVPADWDLTADALIHFPQLTRVRFTDRVTSGYVAGEEVSLVLTSGASVETYTVTITQAMLGTATTSGSLAMGTKVAKAMLAAMLGSPTYFAYKVGTGDDYENLRIRRRDMTGGAFTAAITYAGTAVITVSNDTTYGGAPVLYRASFRAALLEAVAASNAGTTLPVTRRLHGRVATEFLINLPFTQVGGSTVHPHLMARACIRLYRGGAVIRSDISFEQTHLRVPNQRTLNYSMRLLNGATSLFYQAPFAHHYSARWHKDVWYGPQPSVRYRHNMAYFTNSRATYPYNLGLTINESAISAEFNKLQSHRDTQVAWGPMSWLLLQPLMGTTGGRPDIGPAPKWHAMYLLTQDDRALEVMLANADAAGTANTHFRNEETGLIVDVETFPGISQLHTSSPTLPARPDQQPWGPDAEHQASFAYVPYLVTGEYFYLEETQFWSAWSLMRMNAGYRSYEKGLVWRQTVRAQSWTLRNTCDAARITPETHPLKGFFQRVKQHNLDWYADNYRDGTSNPSISPMGSLAHSTASTAPWQNDFFSIVIALNKLNNEPKAAEILDYVSRFTVGRVNTPEYCLREAAGYYWNTNADGVFFTTWAQWYAAEYPGVNIASCPTRSVAGSPEVTFGYAAILQGQLSVLAEAGVAGAATGYAAYRPLVIANFANDPTWAFKPPT